MIGGPIGNAIFASLGALGGGEITDLDDLQLPVDCVLAGDQDTQFSARGRFGLPGEQSGAMMKKIFRE